MAAGEALAYGSRLVEALHEAGDEVHLVMTREAERALGDDLERGLAALEQALAAALDTTAEG